MSGEQREAERISGATAPCSRRRGKRHGQLRYYIRAALRERRGKRWRRFWVARWFWSCGRLGPVPVMYSADYWERPTKAERERSPKPSAVSVSSQKEELDD